MCCGSGRVVPTTVENGLVEGNAREVLYLVWLVFISRVILQFGRLLRHLLQEFAARGKELVQTAILDVAIEALLEACFGLGMLDRLESPLESNFKRFRGTRGGGGGGFACICKVCVRSDGPGLSWLRGSLTPAFEDIEDFVNWFLDKCPDDIAESSNNNINNPGHRSQPVKDRPIRLDSLPNEHIVRALR